MKYLFCLLLVIGLGGCGLMNSHYIKYNFEQDQEQTASVGSEMLNVTDEYRSDVYGTVRGKFETTLTYSGKEGKIIKIEYREVSDNYARPAFDQELTYDLAESNIITFKSTKIKVIKATNSFITFVVLESPAYKYKSGDKIIDSDSN